MFSGYKTLKFLKGLEPNCEEAKDNTTSIMENTVPAAPIITPEIVESILRAESVLAVKIYFQSLAGFRSNRPSVSIVQLPIKLIIK